MNRTTQLFFVGYIEKVAQNGESMKNHLFIDRFKEIYDKVYTFDAKGVKHKPWKILKLIWFCFWHRRMTIFVSASYSVGEPLVKIMRMMGCQNIYYWVVGGIFHNKIKKGELSKAFYQKLKCIVVQNSQMLESLKEQGFTNAYYVSNSKRINHLPDISLRKNEKIRFVFLSRINPTKGCGEIIESVKQLNGMGYQDRFSVDFYGAIDLVYPEFPDLIKGINNISYNGFLDLTHDEGYDSLSKYDMMLFPTYWVGEGFPGVIIDSYIAGVPVLASDWNLNTEYVSSQTGIIIPHHNQERLFAEMKNIIDGKYNIKEMARISQSQALKYDNRKVITPEVLKRMGAL